MKTTEVDYLYASVMYTGSLMSNRQAFKDFDYPTAKAKGFTGHIEYSNVDLVTTNDYLAQMDLEEAGLNIEPVSFVTQNTAIRQYAPEVIDNFGSYNILETAEVQGASPTSRFPPP